MKTKLLVAIALTAILSSFASADWTPGFLPGVWWEVKPVGPPILVQPMRRVRVRARLFRWWTPPAIDYAPSTQPPTWGRFEGGWGTPPALPSSLRTSETLGEE